MDAILLTVLAVFLVIVGMAGMLFPVIPGAPLMFAGMLLAAWAEDFEYVGIATLAILAVLALLTWLVDLVAGVFGARRFGASGRAMLGAGIGAFVGIFFGLPGVILGPFVGACIGEFMDRPDLKAAGCAGVGATIGLAIGAAAKIAIAFTMIGIYAVMRLA